MADCAAAGGPLLSPAPSTHRCAAAGLDKRAEADPQNRPLLGTSENTVRMEIAVALIALLLRPSGRTAQSPSTACKIGDLCDERRKGS
jgi:hypothetical protein